MSIESSREIKWRKSMKINSINKLLVDLAEHSPSKKDVEMTFYFEQVEKYLEKQVEELELNGEW